MSTASFNNTQPLPKSRHPMSNPETGRAPAQPADSGPLKKLNDPIGFYKPISWPINLDAVDHVMTIGAYESRHFPATQGATRDKASRTIKQKVHLPMPSNLVTSYQQEYQNEQLGPVGMGVAAGLDKNSKGFDDMTKAFGKMASAKDVKEALKSAGGAFDKSTDFVAGVIGTTAKEIGLAGAKSVGIGLAKEAAIAGAAVMGLGGAALGEGISKGIDAFVQSKGVATNPHQAVMYRFPNFRSFQFSWEMRPKNHFESLAIAKIVAFFKFYSSPSFEGEKSMFFKTPNQFMLKFRHDQFLFAIGDCVLTNFTVDYHGEGTPIYYDAAGSIRSGNRKLKAPAVVKIQCEFQENTIVTKESIRGGGR